MANGEHGTDWLAFLRGLVARGQAGVALVTSDAPTSLRSSDFADPWASGNTVHHRLTRTGENFVPVQPGVDHLSWA